MKRLLLVEDDKLISRTLGLGLQYRGFEVTICETAADGRKRFNDETFDIAVLDINLPDDTGYSLCRSFREKDRAIPILMLTARVDEGSAVKGLGSGADDYVRKPCGLEELTARLNRLVGKKREERIEFGSIHVSLKQRLAWVNETLLALYRREFELLSLLIQKAGEVVSREDILKSLDHDGEMLDRTIDSHLSHLRRKLKAAGLSDVQIVPVYGVGYRMERK